jgi:hypothetical protein
MKIVAILHRSAGNESVGDMWRETKVFDELATAQEILEWAASCLSDFPAIKVKNFRGHLEITVAQEQEVKSNITTLGSMVGI